MPTSRETRADRRRPCTRRHGRLNAEQLRRLSGRVHRATRTRVATIDGKRRFQAMTDKRAKVVLHVIQEVGWKGRDRLFIGQIAGDCDTTMDTVGRALGDAEAFGWIRRHPEWRTRADGTRERDSSTFELLPCEPQLAGGNCTNESILPFWRHRCAQAERRRDAKRVLVVVWDATDPPPDAEKAAAVMAMTGW
jgi:hypothetical protein